MPDMTNSRVYQPSDRDYKDSPYSQYLNTCSSCKYVFIGPKRQPSCAVCSTNKPYVPGPGPIFTADVECDKWPRCGCPHLFECMEGA